MGPADLTHNDRHVRQRTTVKAGTVIEDVDEEAMWVTIG
jgi:hypothetical protein